MNDGQFLMILTVAVILIISYFIPQENKKFFTCVSWLVSGIFLFNIIMMSGFDFASYSRGNNIDNRFAMQFFSLSDDWTRHLIFGFVVGILIAIIAFVWGLLPFLKKDKSQMATFPLVKPLYVLLATCAFIYILPLAFFFAGADFEYAIIHGSVNIPVGLFAFSLYMGFNKTFRWFYPLVVLLPAVPIIMLLSVNPNLGSYLTIALYGGFAYFGAICAFVINKGIRINRIKATPQL